MLRIFLVEDHPVVLESLLDVFEFEDDFEAVGSAMSASQALEMIDPGAVDIVVTDLSLPGMTGLELTRELCRRHSGLRVLVLSGHQDRIYSEQAREAGAQGFLTKTRIVADLIPALKSVSEGKVVFSA